MRWLILALAAIPTMAIWATVVFVGTANGWWRSPLAPSGDSGAFVAAVQQRLERANPGNAAFRLLEAGRVAGEHYLSSDDPVGPDSRFQMASVSKWFTAWGVMTLVESGAVRLDAPIDRYLTRWHLPDGPFDNSEVTVRRLLSHTAGLTDGLGYGGFAPGMPVQTLEDSLTRASDAMPGAEGRTRVGLEPGSQWRYSGGGYALLQLLIEEVTGRAFNDYLTEAVLAPLGLVRTTFVLEPPPRGDVVTSYDSDGNPAPHYRFAAPAAAGLYTSASDLTRFIQAQLPGPAGESPGRGVLTPQTLERMREPHARVMGTPIWGLGHMLYAGNGQGGYIIGHEGSNRPAINTSVRFDPASGDGVILLVTGDRELAGSLGSEWVFWRTGRLDVTEYIRTLGGVVRLIGIGWIVIGGIFVFIGWRATRRPAGSDR